MFLRIIDSNNIGMMPFGSRGRSVSIFASGLGVIGFFGWRQSGQPIGFSPAAAFQVIRKKQSII
jgi:hypothetical protein